MLISQAQIDELLLILKTLLDQIMPIRERLAQIEKELAQVQQEYDKIIGPHNSEADRLEALKHSLRARLARRKVQTVVMPAISPVPQATQPPAVVDLELSPDEPPPPPPPEDPWMARKRALADHIYYFLDPSQQIIMQTINAFLMDDDQRGLGEMLEVLVWGVIWSERADWESLQEQYERLEEWQQALDGRLAFWQAEELRLKNDSRMALWQERQARTQEAWLAFLDKLAGRQQAENERLAKEIAILERAWQEQEAASEGEINHV